MDYKALESLNYWTSEPKNLGLQRSHYLSRLEAYDQTDSLIVISGARRSGKSVLMKQWIALKIQEGVPRMNILFFNFFVQKLSFFTKEANLLLAIEKWQKETDSQYKKYIIIDEIQEVEDWDLVVASLFEDHTLDAKILITGSNSQLLANDATSRLSGRYFSLTMYPFSYLEFCQIKKTSPDDSFSSYLESSSSPELCLVDDPEAKENLMRGIINTTIQKDIIERYNPSNPALLSRIIKYIRLNSSNQFSIKAITDSLNNQLKKTDSVSLNTVEKYLEYIKTVYFCHECPTYSYRKKEVLERNSNKYYLNDTGMSLFLEGFEKGRIFENVIYLELLKKGYEVKTYFAYKSRNREVDFHATKSKRSLFIQVTWMLSDKSENKSLWDREIGNLESINQAGEKVVVCMDGDDHERIGDIVILSPVKFVTHI